MSNTEEDKRRRLPFTELMSILSLLSVIIRVIVVGLVVLAFSEIYFYFSGAAKRGWVDALETFYGKIWVGAKSVGSAAFGGRTAGPSGACEWAAIVYNADGTRKYTWNVPAKYAPSGPGEPGVRDNGTGETVFPITITSGEYAGSNVYTNEARSSFLKKLGMPECKSQ